MLPASTCGSFDCWLHRHHGCGTKKKKDRPHRLQSHETIENHVEGSRFLDALEFLSFFGAEVRGASDNAAFLLTPREK
jgi:hypothetical protein